ncbi:MAG: 6-pyruvoyl trahydropterin synthase family protein [Planctomycetota bacterium]|jgi:6-pyruvoyltetrahydropterin/6-carboxytetrahydropterin synthase
MTSAVRRITFNAGHRLWKHEGRCEHVHGHNYVVFFHATADKLDSVGRVIDFNVMKLKLGGWIEEHWDHGFICHQGDRVVQEALSAIPGQKIFLLDSNPTAENLAGYLLQVVGPQQLADTGVRLHKVVLWETENCSAEVSL